MRSNTTLAKGLFAFICLGVVALILFPQAVEGSQPSFAAVPTSEAAFLAQPAAFPMPMLPQQLADGQAGNNGNGGITAVAVEPTSTLGIPDFRCSVRTDSGGSNPTCSAGGSTQLGQCSVECDGGPQECSAFHGTTADTAFCSTLGGTNESCSILLPGASPATGAALCSAGGGRPQGEVLCSVSGTGRYQVCSVEQPRQRPQFLNACSAKNLYSSANLTQCSVIGQGATKAACTAITAGNTKFCSVLSNVADCSVRTAPTGAPFGKCTSLRGSDPGSCTVAVGAQGGHCSVIGGLPGDPCGSH